MLPSRKDSHEIAIPLQFLARACNLTWSPEDALEHTARGLKLLPKLDPRDRARVQSVVNELTAKEKRAKETLADKKSVLAPAIGRFWNEGKGMLA